MNTIIESLNKCKTIDEGNKILSSLNKNDLISLSIELDISKYGSKEILIKNILFNTIQFKLNSKAIQQK